MVFTKNSKNILKNIIIISSHSPENFKIGAKTLPKKLKIKQLMYSVIIEKKTKKNNERYLYNSNLKK